MVNGENMTNSESSLDLNPENWRDTTEEKEGIDPIILYAGAESDYTKEEIEEYRKAIKVLTKYGYIDIVKHQLNMDLRYLPNPKVQSSDKNSVDANLEIYGKKRRWWQIFKD